MKANDLVERPDERALEYLPSARALMSLAWAKARKSADLLDLAMFNLI